MPPSCSTRTRHSRSSRRFSRTCWSKARTGAPTASSAAMWSRRAAGRVVRVELAARIFDDEPDQRARGASRTGPWDMNARTGLAGVAFARRLMATAHPDASSVLSRRRTRLDAAADVMAGLTPSAKALAAVGAARSAATADASLVVPTDKDVEQLTADVRFFYGALEGASDAATRARRCSPCPSLQVDPYRGHDAAFPRRGRACTGAARRRLRVGPHRRRVCGRAAAARQPAGAPARAPRSRSRSGRRSSRSAGGSAGGRRLHPRGSRRRARLVHDPRRHRGRLPGQRCRTGARWSSSATWSRRCGGSIPATQRSTGAIDHVAIVPVRERFDDEDARLSILDFLARPRPVARIGCLRARPGRAAGHEGSASSWRAATRTRPTRGHVAPLPPAAAFTDVGGRSTARDRHRRRVWRNWPLTRPTAPATCATSPVSPRWSFAVASATGWPTSARRGSAATPSLFVADSPGRAERTVEILQRLRDRRGSG